MINLLPLTFIFIYSWFTIFLFHELCHIIEGFRHGADDAEIYIDKYWIFPTMRCWSNHNGHDDAVAFAGGIYSGIISLIIGIYAALTPTMWDFPFEFSFIVIGSINIVYGIYEGTFLNKLDYDEYMRYHYMIYIVMFIIMVMVYLPLIGEYIKW